MCGVNGMHRIHHLKYISSFVGKSHAVARRARPSQLVCMGPNESSDPPEPSSEGVDIPDEERKRNLERLYRKSPSEWPPKNNYEEKVLGDIKTTGMEGIEKIAGDLKEELTDVDAATEKYAKDLVDDEMGKVLTQYQEKQDQLLATQKLQAEEIRKEAKLIQELASSVQNPPESIKRRASREKILLSLSGLFGVAALYYFWSGITENSSTYIQNAAIDAVVAAFIAFLSSSSFSRGESDDANNSK